MYVCTYVASPQNGYLLYNTIQWNSSKINTIGEVTFVPYKEVSLSLLE